MDRRQAVHSHRKRCRCLPRARFRQDNKGTNRESSSIRCSVAEPSKIRLDRWQVQPGCDVTIRGPGTAAPAMAAPAWVARVEHPCITCHGGSFTPSEAGLGSGRKPRSAHSTNRRRCPCYQSVGARTQYQAMPARTRAARARSSAVSTPAGNGSGAIRTAIAWPCSIARNCSSDSIRSSGVGASAAKRRRKPAR